MKNQDTTFQAQGLGETGRVQARWGNWIRELAQPHHDELPHVVVVPDLRPRVVEPAEEEDGLAARVRHHAVPGARRGVALQVAFERQTLKPVFPLDRL